jgi:hypothetical protein
MSASVRPTLVAIGLFCLIVTGTMARAFIDNGISADPRQFPYVVRLLGADPSRDCTGTIIGPNTVLTAAHCVLGLDPKNPQMSIHLPDGRIMAAAAFLAYPGSDAHRMDSLSFGAGGSADKSNALEYLRLVRSELAVIKPDPSVHFAQWVELDPSPTAPGQPVTLVGYGMNSKVDHNGNGPLRVGTNQLQWESQGVLFLTGLGSDKIDPTTTDPKPDGQQASPDRGDSGGPLFSNSRLIGVVVASQEPNQVGEGYEPINRALGAATGHLMDTNDDLLWCFYASINDSENLSFLTKTATEQGYQIAWAQQKTPIVAPTLKSSPAFNELQSRGDFSR